MQFADKLNFLMNITQTSNKELAIELGVDRSLISLLRNGKRGVPRSVKKMALFFAKRSTAKFQRHALSEMLGQAAIRSGMPTELLAERLEKWLLGEADIMGELAESIRELPTAPPPSRATEAAPAPKERAQFFFGEEGRREAMRRVMQAIRSLDRPGSILTVVDDNLEWLLSDYLLTRQLQADLMEIINRGFSFYQIMPPLNYINRYAESLQFWLPLYATGSMKVYYYPRLRGNLYRHSIVVVPGCCVQYACSISVGSTSDITMFSTDPELVSAFTRQFQEHLSLCLPALTVHPNPMDGIPALMDVFSRPGDSVQMFNALSINSAPAELLERFAREAGDPDWAKLFRVYRDESPHFEERLKQGLFIDMSRLASAEDIRAGRVFVANPVQTHPAHLRYTPETYVLHLQNILRLMNSYEQYCFLPLHDKEPPDYNLIANESGLALLARTTPPLTMLEMRQPGMVTACREHLLRKAEALGYDGIQREKICIELKSLIRELQR